MSTSERFLVAQNAKNLIDSALKLDEVIKKVIIYLNHATPPEFNYYNVLAIDKLFKNIIDNYPTNESLLDGHYTKDKIDNLLEIITEFCALNNSDLNERYNDLNDEILTINNNIGDLVFVQDLIPSTNDTLTKLINFLYSLTKSNFDKIYLVNETLISLTSDHVNITDEINKNTVLILELTHTIATLSSTLNEFRSAITIAITELGSDLTSFKTFTNDKFDAIDKLIILLNTELTNTNILVSVNTISITTINKRLTEIDLLLTFFDTYEGDDPTDLKYSSFITEIKNFKIELTKLETSIEVNKLNIEDNGNLLDSINEALFIDPLEGLNYPTNLPKGYFESGMIDYYAFKELSDQIHLDINSAIILIKTVINEVIKTNPDDSLTIFAPTITIPTTTLSNLNSSGLKELSTSSNTIPLTYKTGTSQYLPSTPDLSIFFFASISRIRSVVTRIEELDKLTIVMNEKINSFPILPADLEATLKYLIELSAKNSEDIEFAKPHLTDLIRILDSIEFVSLPDDKVLIEGNESILYSTLDPDVIEFLNDGFPKDQHIPIGDYKFLNMIEAILSRIKALKEFTDALIIPDITELNKKLKELIDKTNYIEILKPDLGTKLTGLTEITNLNVSEALLFKGTQLKLRIDKNLDTIVLPVHLYPTYGPMGNINFEDRFNLFFYTKKESNSLLGSGFITKTEEPEGKVTFDCFETDYSYILDLTVNLLCNYAVSSKQFTETTYSFRILGGKLFDYDLIRSHVEAISNSEIHTVGYPGISYKTNSSLTIGMMPSGYPSTNIYGTGLNFAPFTTDNIFITRPIGGFTNEYGQFDNINETFMFNYENIESAITWGKYLEYAKVPETTTSLKLKRNGYDDEVSIIKIDSGNFNVTVTSGYKNPLSEDMSFVLVYKTRIEIDKLSKMKKIIL